MKRFTLLVALVTFFTGAFQPPAKPLPKGRPLPATPKKTIKQLIENDEARKKEIYYDAAHLRSLDQQKIPKHLPMLILIDELQDETEQTDNIPITFELCYGIKRKLYPILTTASILKNLLARMDPKRKNLSETDKLIQEFVPVITPQDWRIYNVPESQFVLLIPTHLSQLFGPNIGIKQLTDLTNLLNDPSNFMLQSWLTLKKKNIPFSKKDLDNVFITKTDTTPTPVWDFIISGHGNNNPAIIANLSPQRFNEMLDFFDKKIKTGMALVISCYSGGTNRKLLETTDQGIQINHTYILILNSVSNQVVTALFPRDYDYAYLFFNNAAQIQDKGSSFDTLWEDLAQTKIRSSKFSVHGLQNIPQVWFPGGLGFQSANIPDLVFPLGNVLLKKHQENKEPIVIIGDALVLLYPAVIDVPLTVYPTTIPGSVDKTKWKYIPHIFELNFTRDDKTLFEKILTQLVAPQVLTTVGFSQPDAADKLIKSLYPQFISLNTNRTGHLFTEINVESTLFDKSSRIKGLGAGVIQFIRDAFLDVDSTESTITFIDKLVGFNDISLLREGSRIVRNDSNKNIMEQFLQNVTGQKITLENVMILTNNQNLSFRIYFAIGDTVWEYTSAQAQEDAKLLDWWNFRFGNDRRSYDNDYLKYKTLLVQKSETLNQKTISEILEKKQRQMLLKQAAQLQQKAAASKKPRPLPAPLGTQKSPAQAPRALPTPPSTQALEKRAPRPLPAPPTNTP